VTATEPLPGNGRVCGAVIWKRLFLKNSQFHNFGVLQADVILSGEYLPQCKVGNSNYVLLSVSHSICGRLCARSTVFGV
jgi:hypothetical protein